MSDCIDFGYNNGGLLTQAGNLTIGRDPQKGGLIAGTELNVVMTGRTYNAFGEMNSFDARYLVQHFVEILGGKLEKLPTCLVEYQGGVRGIGNLAKAGGSVSDVAGVAGAVDTIGNESGSKQRNRN